MNNMFATFLKNLEVACNVKGFDILSTSLLRIETPFKYPDGSYIDLYVEMELPLLEDQGFILTDAGETMAWLVSNDVRPWSSSRKQNLLNGAIQNYGVRQTGGALELPLQTPDDIGRGIINLAQACIRVADIHYTHRYTSKNTFTEDVEEFFSNLNVSFEKNVELKGRGGRAVKVDYLIEGEGPQSDSAILTLSASNQQYARSRATDLFAKWYDLGSSTDERKNLTFWNNGKPEIYHRQDLDRLKEYSRLVPFLDREVARNEIMAA